MGTLRLVTRENKRKLIEMAETFTADIVTRAFKRCRNSKAFGPDIFHLKNLGPRAIEYITALFNLSVNDPDYMEVFINYTVAWLRYLPKDLHIDISRFSAQQRKSWKLILPTINKYLLPSPDQHGFRREHSTTSALLQLTTDITMGFNQRKPPDRTVCVAVDL